MTPDERPDEPDAPDEIRVDLAGSISPPRPP
jgi:hypothetical protein